MSIPPKDLVSQTAQDVSLTNTPSALFYKHLRLLSAPCVRWKRSDKVPAPLKIWNPTDGTFVELYKCPTCGDPFLPIKNAEDVKYCPKCNRPTIECKHVVAYD